MVLFLIMFKSFQRECYNIFDFMACNSFHENLSFWWMAKGEIIEHDSGYFLMIPLSPWTMSPSCQCYVVGGSCSSIQESYGERETKSNCEIRCHGWWDLESVVDTHVFSMRKIFPFLKSNQVLDSIICFPEGKDNPVFETPRGIDMELFLTLRYNLKTTKF